MNSVDVWFATLDVPAHEVAALSKVLDTPEQDRASRFHQEVDRSRYVVGRGILRSLLGEYTSTPPDLVPLCVLPNGKPSLDPRANPNNVHFNVSHSGDQAVFAFSGKPVGIDIQETEGFAAAYRVVAHFFAPREATAFDQMDAAKRERFFFRTWARKEAYLKATGEALSVDPSKVRVEDSHGGSTELAGVDSAIRIDEGFRVYDLAAPSGHVCAIAIDASLCPPAIRIRDWARDHANLPHALQRSPGSSIHTDAASFETPPEIRVV